MSILAKGKIRFVLNLKVSTEKWQEDILETRFEIARQIYNAVLNVSLKRYKEMVKHHHFVDNSCTNFSIIQFSKCYLVG